MNLFKKIVRRGTFLKGFGLIEVVVGVGILALIVTSLVFILQNMAIYSSDVLYRTQAAFLLDEGMEAAKSLRDKGWNAHIGTLTSGTTYSLTFDPVTGWGTTTSVVPVDTVFFRTFVLSDVYRDAVTDDIAAAGVVDPHTKKITVTVSWSKNNATTTRSLTAYVTNLFDI